jgi:hypothetical protein
MPLVIHCFSVLLSREQESGQWWGNGSWQPEVSLNAKTLRSLGTDPWRAAVITDDGEGFKLQLKAEVGCPLYIDRKRINKSR